MLRWGCLACERSLCRNLYQRGVSYTHTVESPPWIAGFGEEIRKRQAGQKLDRF